MTIKTKLTAATIAAYRKAATRPSVVERIEELNGFSCDHEALNVAGLSGLADGAEKAWLAAARRFGADPAATAEEAHLKTGYLGACLEAWVWANARRGNHVPSAALIDGFVAAEQTRWGQPTRQAKPN